MGKKWGLVVVCFLVTASLFGVSTRKLKRKLYQALRMGDSEKTAKVVQEIASFGGKLAVQLLLNTAKRFQGDEKLYWILLHGAASVQDEEGMETFARFLLRYKRHGISRDALLALSQNRTESALIVHRVVLEKGSYDLKLLSVDQLSEIRSIRSVDILLDGWKKIKKDKKAKTLKRRIWLALMALTGENLGPLYESWRSWWQQHRQEGLKSPGERSRGQTVVRRFGFHRGTGLKELKKLDKKKILVITGSPCQAGSDHNFDRIEDTLARLEIPHTVVTKKEFNQGYSLQGVMVVLLNCTLFWSHCVCPTCKAGGTTVQRLKQCTGCSKHIVEEDKLNQDGIRRIQAFVARGGYLFTEDWGLVELLEKAWPKFIGRKGTSQEEMEVNILPRRFQGSHPLLRGIFGYRKREEETSGDASGKTVLRRFRRALEKVKHTWKVDRESPLIGVKSPLVQVLLVSPELARKTKVNGIVAVTFMVSPDGRRPRTGRYFGEISEMQGGRVLHVISHFGKQKSDGDEYTLENLLVNFLLEAKSRWDIRRGR